MKNPILIKHAQGAPGLRFLGIGAFFKPSRGIQKLLRLLKNNTSWASIRTAKDIKTMLKKSSVVVSIWSNNQMIGFGRATTDESYRAVLWDIVIDKNYQNKGLGKIVVNNLLKNRAIYKVEKIYIMTTFCNDFYSKMGFINSENQKLMVFEL